jgi:phosphatidylglycerol:prolipoprotein diacylglycerol transferase
MFPIIQIGPIAFQAPGLFWIAGIWLGLLIAENQSKKNMQDANHIYNLVLIGLLAGIFGARLGYFVQYFSIFSTNLFNVFSLTLTMLNVEAGLALGLITSAIYMQRKKMPFWMTLDILTSGLSIFIIFYHLANLASGESFGTQSTIPWAIDLWGQLRHPVQVYESTAAFVIAIALWPRAHHESAPGTRFWLFVTLTSLARLFFEYFRGDSTTFFWNLHLAQVVAWVLLSLSLWQLGVRIRKSDTSPKSIENISA